MPLANSVCAVFCAFSLWSAGPSHARRPDALTVHVRLAFDRSTTSTVFTAVARHEVAAIWNVEGVELLWSDDEVEAAVHLDVMVARHRTDFVRRQEEPVLGSATIDRSGLTPAPIRIWCDAIESLLQRRPFSNALLRDQELARALGRVVAHELGHVLLGAPAYHDPDGLMRATFPAEDLAGLDRRTFQLSDRSAIRLRESIARLRGAQSPELCTHCR